jgi:hypothetical protein
MRKIYVLQYVSILRVTRYISNMTYRAPTRFRHGRTARICNKRFWQIFLTLLVDGVGVIIVHVEERASRQRQLELV